MSFFIDNLLHSVEQLLRTFFQKSVNIGFLQSRQYRERTGHGERIARKSAGLIDLTQWHEVLHDFAFAAIGADRHASAKSLAEAGQVGAYTVKGLRSSVGHPKSGEHFIKDENHTVFGAEISQALQETFLRYDESHCAGHGFPDY